MRGGYFWDPTEIMKRIIVGPIPICESETKSNTRFSVENLLETYVDEKHDFIIALTDIT